MTDIQQRLFALQDVAYGDFHSRLMPTVERARVIGVRTPALRQLAKELAHTEQAAAFLRELPHTYYEENNLHAALLEGLRDFDALLAALDAFLPHVDNWATCDMLRPRVFARHKSALLPKIQAWLTDPHPYTVRFGIGMLMAHYLDADFQPEYLEWVAAVDSGEYYVNMMVAWYFATALAKQYDAAMPFLESRRLDPWLRHKAIQKAVESRRITSAQKAYLRTLKMR